MKTKKVIILGATGSIGRQTIDCIESANAKTPGSFVVSGLCAKSSAEALLAAGRKFPSSKLALSGKNKVDSIHYCGPNAYSDLLRGNGRRFGS